MQTYVVCARKYIRVYSKKGLKGTYVQAQLSSVGCTWTAGWLLSKRTLSGGRIAMGKKTKRLLASSCLLLQLVCKLIDEIEQWSLLDLMSADW